MLKIKEGIPLGELKKYGFIPKYNEGTREIERYVYKIESIDTVAIMVEFTGEITIRETYTIVLELLYDLIQAGIVVKE